MRQSAKRRRAAGFTMIEVLIAMVILAIGLITVLSIFPVAAMQQRRAIDDTQGIIVGHNVLASLRNVPATYFTNPTFTSGALTFGGTFSVPTPFPALPFSSTNPPLYVDPSGVYDYQLAWRQQGSSYPIEVAVFVYRKGAAMAVSNTPFLTASTTTAAAAYLNIATTTAPQGSPYLVVSPTIATTNGMNIAPVGNLTPPAGTISGGTARTAALRPAFAPGDRNQVLLYVVGTNNEPFVVRTISDNMAETAPTIANPDPNPLSNYNVFFLPQKAVAIVTGTVP